MLTCTSGYGVQGRSLLPRLAVLPEIDGRENIANFAWYGSQGGIHSIDSFRVYPAGVDPYGNDVIGAHTRHFDANVVISLIDVWVMKETAQKVAPALWLPWTPIDHTPIPDAVLESLRGAHMTLSYSRWGEKMLNDVGVPNVYIPHGVEPTVYNVNPNVDTVRSFKRQIMKCDGGFLSVMVAANKGFPDRKAFQVQLRAWADFAKDKPDARLYIHTERSPMYGGIDLDKLVVDLGIGDKVSFPDRYEYYLGLPPEYLAMVYNSADVLMANSMSEGFGIPIIEAQACGVPVITTDFSAMPELVRWGYTIAPADMVRTPMNAWQAWPDAIGITEALGELYAQWRVNRAWDTAQRLSTSAQIHAEYSWDSIVQNYWAPFISQIAEIAPPTRASQQVALPPPVASAPVQHKARAKRGNITAIKINDAPVPPVPEGARQ